MRIFGAVLAMTLATSAQAQQAEVANNATFGDWVVNCEAVSTQRTSCRVVQTQSRSDTGALFLRLIAYAQPEGGAVLVAQTPIGVYLPADVVFRAEGDADTPQTAMIWQRCLGDICEAALELDAESLQALEDGGAALFGYQPAPGQDAAVARVETTALIEALDTTRPE